MKAIKKLKTKIMRKIKKKVKTVPTKEELQVEVKRYLECASRHLFIKKDFYDKEFKEDRYFKVMPVEIEGELHYVAITMSPTRVDIDVKSADWVKTKNDLDMFKDEVFPGYYKHKSIKGYVGDKVIKMKSLFQEIGMITEVIPGITKDEFREEVKRKIDYYHKWVEISDK